MCDMLSNKCNKCNHVDTDNCKKKVPQCNKCTYSTLTEDDIAHKHFCKNCKATPDSTKCYFMPREKSRSVCSRCVLKQECSLTKSKLSCDNCSNKDSLYCDICKGSNQDGNNLCLFNSKDK